VINFDSYAFDLSDLTESRGEALLRASDRDLGFLLHPDPTDKDYIAKPGSYRAELHRRLTDWILPLVFALVSLAVAGDARSHREARLHPMVSALTIAFALRWAAFYAANQIDNNAIYIPILYAIPIIASVIAVVFLCLHKRMVVPSSFGEKFGVFWKRIQDRLPRTAGKTGGGAVP
jgi:lipopolysaccharide export system permease protein